jgi:transposase
MEVVHEVACGLDVHQATVVACVLSGRGEKPKKQKKTFNTFTRGLRELREWLSEQGCTQVAMESTGVYWRPVYAALEGQFDLTVGNAQHMKNVPSRKTDMNDAEWIARLLRAGMVAKSFVPPEEIRELRKLIRTQRMLVNERTQQRNRIQKALVECNVKLAMVMTDVFGVSGEAILRAVVAGESDRSKLSALARGTLRKKTAEIEDALEAQITPIDRAVVGTFLALLDHLDAALAELQTKIDGHLERFSVENKLLQTIPGIGTIVAATIIAEIGVDMSQFRSDHHLAAWAGLAPPNHESAGKKTSAKSRRGNVYLKTIMVEAAHAAIRKKDTFWAKKFYFLKSKRGHMRALIAIAHKILKAVWHVLTAGEEYKELGPAYLDSLRGKQSLKNLVRRLEQQGYRVEKLDQGAA